MHGLSRVGRVLSASTAFVLAAAGLVAIQLGAAAPAAAETVTSPVVDRPATAVTSAPLPTVQIDSGVVWSQTMIGNTVYAVGKFTNTRPYGVTTQGTSLTARNNILAYDVTTGNLITAFNPNLNGEAKTITLSPDKKRLYVGGLFTTVGGKAQAKIAAIDPTSGALITTFKAALNGTVTGIAATDTTVYAGGSFNASGSTSRSRLAAFRASDGALTSWAPTADADLTSMVLTPDQSKVVIGGKFQNVTGTPAQGVTALDPTSGAVLTWSVNTVIHNGNDQSGTYSLSADNDTVYGSSFNYGTGNFEGIFAMNQDGSIRWLADCHGDTYTSFSMNDVVYNGGHTHNCSNIQGFPERDPRWEWRAMAYTKAATNVVQPNSQAGSGYGDFRGQPAPSTVYWFPEFGAGTQTNLNQAVWSLSGNGTYLVAGGEFPSLNGKKQQGLVRFAVPSVAGANASGPTQLGGVTNPTVRPLGSYAARVNWTANWDRDDRNLTYKVVRADKASTPLDTRTVQSTFWDRPTLSFTDKNVVPGQTYRYRILVSDPTGTGTQSDYVSVTIPVGAALSAYAQAVIDDGATNYYRLDDAAGSTLADLAGANDMTKGSAVSANTDGAIGDDSNGSAKFSKATGTGATKQVVGPQTFTQETWIRTTSTTGGKILGFGNSATGSSSGYDRQLYMDNAGHLTFGVYPNTVRALTTPDSYNDGQWHHVVAELSAAGQVLYVDGIQQRYDASTTSAQDYSGYWRLGDDNLTGWPNTGSSTSFDGDIDDTAIYPTALTVNQIRAHYTKSGRSVDLPAQPADAYGAAVYNDNPSLYWRLDDTSGPAIKDSGINRQPGVSSGGVTFGTASPVSGSTGSAQTFNGSNGTLGSAKQTSNPTVYSEELWFSTTTNQGGKLIGLGNAQSGQSDHYDRHVYMEDSGQLTFGTYTGQLNTTTSPKSYNDGVWHHMVATQGSDGMKLYVDGVLVGDNSQTGAENYSGYWRVGGDTAWGGSSPFFNGSIDEVAVYPVALSADQVRAHYSASPAATNAAPTASFTSSCAGGGCSFDGSASADPDGAVASYAWDFGDGQVGSGATVDHLYTKTGTYPVTFTVTDDHGKTASTSKDITVTVNAAPTAVQTSSCTALACSFDGSGSTDADGTVASYAWNFGDNTTGTGASTSHTYAAAGTYSVVLTVTDDGGVTDTVTRSVTVSKSNAAPTAAFTSDVSGLVASLDASSSTDADGTVASYGWDFGDSKTGTGKTTSHTYAAAGTYSVVLTVTDDDGATDTATKSVTVTAASPTVASDTFGRTVTGWGSADTGGAWTLAGGSANFATNGSTGVMKLAATSTLPMATLDSVSVGNVVVTTDLSVDKIPNGTGASTQVLARRSGKNYYWLKVRYMADGSVNLAEGRTVNGAESVIKEVKASGVTYTAGSKLRLKFSVSGTSTAALTGKVWLVGSAEPAANQISVTDSTADLAISGSVGLRSYTSGTTTNVPVTVSVDNFTAVRQ